MTFLSCSLFDSYVGEDIASHIISGSYRFRDFATSQWPKLVSNLTLELSHQNPPDDLVNLLENFMNIRENAEFEDVNNDAVHPRYHKLFSGKWPTMHKKLCQVLEFQRKRDLSDWSVDEGM